MTTAMQWRKLGLIDGILSPRPGYTHAMIPTPVLLPDRIRVYYSVRDERGRGLPVFADLDRADPLRVIERVDEPLLTLGEPGAFDDNGVVPTSVVQAPDGTWLMYYVGFELCTQVRYRLMTGLAVSRDGRHFARHQSTAILDRAPGEELFRCGPFVLVDGGQFRMWYIAGNAWTKIGGKELPIYELRYLESQDGQSWGPLGQISMQITDPDEHGFGRPWVRPTATGYEMFFSVRRRSVGAYRLGYATSTDGIAWTRDDAALNLPASDSGFDAEMICYAVPLVVDGREYVFYNGNDFGRDGIAVAVRR